MKQTPIIKQLTVAIKFIVYGVLTYIPGFYKFSTMGTGGTISARYCYSVWLRHLVITKANGLNANPGTVAELGPGDSLGIGLAALISGCENYFALDIVEYANTDRNIKIFDELVTLFKNKEAIPGEEEFPEVKPYLDNYDFPENILDDNRLKEALEESRLKKIRDSIEFPQHNDSLIQYRVPWHDMNVLEKESVDMIYSQAVLEHVDGLQNAYKYMHLWLKPEGHISHQIDFRCHGSAADWNGHWKYPELIWKLILGKRPYLINREPYSTHISLLKKECYKLIFEKRVQLPSLVNKNKLARRFKSISDEDLVTSGVFIQAKKI